MKKTLQILSIATLLIWGILFLHFYVSGRIERHLDPSFRIYVLLSGIGLVLLAGFNFLNRHRAQGECLHDHHGHDHHDHACGHDHHEHGHEHEHHGHGQQEQEQEQAHAHSHDHEHEHGETPSGVLFAIAVLLGPMLFATAYSRDQFSSEYAAKWAKIERQMMQMRISEGESLGKRALAAVDSSDNPYTGEAVEGEKPTAADAPPEPAADDGTTAGDADRPPERESDTANDADRPPKSKSDDETGEDESANTWSTFTRDDLEQMVPRNDEGDFLLDVPQIFYTAGDRELMDVMEGIPVKTTAQLMEDTSGGGGGKRLQAFRLFIECCAADARPLSIPVEFGEELPTYEEMGWYELFGKLHYSDEEGEILPIIRIDRIEKTTEPTDGLLF